jgi:hypothetical protein
MADLATRIAKYLARCPAAVSGEGGHNRTFRIACMLVNGYALTPEEAMPFFLAYNERCSPPWTERS